MISVSTYSEDGCRSEIDPEDISELLGDGGLLIWVDALEPSPEDFACIEKEFDLHHLAIEDAEKQGQRPKLEQYPTHGFVVAYSASMAEVDVFVGAGWLVTVRGRGEDGKPWDMETARARFERSGPEEATSGFLLYIILDGLVDSYFGRTEATEDRLEALEERIFGGPATREQAMQEDLYELRRELIAFRRRVQPLHGAVSRMVQGEVEWIDQLARTHFQDVYDHLSRAVDQIDSQRELLNNAVDAHLALMSMRMNQVMKKMTSWGALLLGSTLIAAIYGMNFKHMPELNWRLGYPFALGLMATLTISGYLYFKRRDWL